MKREIRIGIFTILMIAGAWASLRFLNGIDLFSRNNTYYAYYDNVDGLHKASSVVIRGVKVGQVSAIELNPDNSDEVRVALCIKDKYTFPSDSQAKIFNDGIMSGVAVEIIIGNSDKSLESGDTITACRATGIFESASSELTELKEQFMLVTEQLNVTLKSVNQMLADNEKSVNLMLNNMEMLTGNTNNIIIDNQQDIRELVSGISTLAQTMGNKSADIDSMICNLSTVSRQLNQSHVVPELGKSMTELNTLLSNLNSCQGSAGKLLGDEGLYDNMVSASANLDSLFLDLKSNPSRYVHFSLFGGKAEKKLRKAEKKSLEEQAKIQNRSK